MSKASKAKKEILEYTQEGLLEFLKRVPRDQISQGFWKVYQERPGRGGGSIQCVVGRSDFEVDQDLEDVAQNQFLETYGGGAYTFKLHDSNRQRIKEMPDIKVHLPGESVTQHPKGPDGEGDDLIAAQVKQTRSSGQLLQATLGNRILEKQLEKLNGDSGGDPLKLAMAEMIKANIKNNGNGKQSSTRELMELAILSKTIAEPPKDQGSSKAIDGIMAAVSGLVTAQSTMNQANMTNFNQSMQMQMTMMQTMGGLNQQDPYIVLLQQAPDLIDRVVGGVVSSIREYRGVALENAAAGAGRALEVDGNGNGKGNRNAAPAPTGQRTAAPPQQKAQNQFLVVVYQNYKHGVPPDTCADQVQHYLSDAHLRGILSLGPEECIERLAQEGLALSFQRDPQLKLYVYKVIEQVKRIYENAAEESAPDKSETIELPDKSEEGEGEGS